MKIITLLAFSFYLTNSFSQLQIGSDIFGESQGDRSGSDIALSDDGTIIAIGAAFNEGNDIHDSGHARVYKKESGEWVQIGQDLDGVAEYDAFGNYVSLSSDGQILAVGAYGHDLFGDNSGYVQIFSYDTELDLWLQLGETIYGEYENDWAAVPSLSSNGQVVAIASTYCSQESYLKGKIKMFRYMMGTWTQIGEDIHGFSFQDKFGRSIQLSANGNIVAAGSPGRDYFDDNRGSVRVFENIDDEWIQLGEEILGDSPTDALGLSLAMSDDGHIIAAGAPGSDDNGDTTGEVKVFQFIENSWTQIGEDIYGTEEGDYLGHELSLSGDGSVLLIGSPRSERENKEDCGYTMLYKNQSGVWSKIVDDMIGDNEQDEFGYGVTVSADGSSFAISSIGTDYIGYGEGRVQVFNVPSSVSVNEYEPLYKLNIYPNPANEYLFIELDSEVRFENAILCNLQGKEIAVYNTQNISLKDISAGPYILKVNTDYDYFVRRLIVE